jgi:hypothetical protein
MFDIPQYALNKILLALGSLAGVNIALILWTPKFVRRRGVIAAAVISTAIAVALALTLGGALLIWLGVDQTKADLVLFVGLVIGAASPFVLNTLQNFFKKYEDKDILEVADAVKGNKK